MTHLQLPLLCQDDKAQAISGTLVGIGVTVTGTAQDGPGVGVGVGVGLGLGVVPGELIKTLLVEVCVAMVAKVFGVGFPALSLIAAARTNWTRKTFPTDTLPLRVKLADRIWLPGAIISPTADTC